MNSVQGKQGSLFITNNSNKAQIYNSVSTDCFNEYPYCKTRNINRLVSWLAYGFYRHFQQYFSYIVAVGSLVDETGENHRTAASHIITLCYIEYIFLILFVDTVLYVYTNEKYEMKGEKKT